MNIRKKDFLDMSLFSMVVTNICMIILLLLINVIYFMINGHAIKLIDNINFFVVFEIFLVILSLLFGLAYVRWFYDYKIDPDGRERKIRKY
jgi:cation transporter-like permease